MIKIEDDIIHGIFLDEESKEIKFINDDRNNQLIFEELETAALKEE